MQAIDRNSQVMMSDWGWCWVNAYGKFIRILSRVFIGRKLTKWRSWSHKNENLAQLNRKWLHSNNHMFQNLGLDQIILKFLLLNFQSNFHVLYIIFWHNHLQHAVYWCLLFLRDVEMYYELSKYCVNLSFSSKKTR